MLQLKYWASCYQKHSHHVEPMAEEVTESNPKQNVPLQITIPEEKKVRIADVLILAEDIPSPETPLLPVLCPHKQE